MIHVVKKITLVNQKKKDCREDFYYSLFDRLNGRFAVCHNRQYTRLEKKM